VSSLASSTASTTSHRFRHAGLKNPLVAAYTTRDSRYIYLSGIQTEGHFERFCSLIGRADLCEDPASAPARLARRTRAECVEVLDGIFAEDDLAHWVDVLRAMTAPWSIVQTAAEAACDPQAVANGYLVTVDGAERTFPLVARPAQFDEARVRSQGDRPSKGRREGRPPGPDECFLRTNSFPKVSIDGRSSFEMQNRSLSLQFWPVHTGPSNRAPSAMTRRPRPCVPRSSTVLTTGRA
jgi:hypothetical protein